MEKLAIGFGMASAGHRLAEVIESTIPAISFPIISKGMSWVRVNDLLIDEFGHEHRVKRKGVILAHFEKKTWALAYAVAYCQSEFNVCRILTQANFKLAKYSEEVIRYKHQLNNAEKNGDVIRENIISDRLSRTILEYDSLINEITPIIKTQSVA